MDLILIVTIILLILYIAITIFIHFGLTKTVKKNNLQPSVSIIISARNEEQNLETCLHTIEILNYPKNKWDVLIINDRSSDNTKEIAENFCEKHSNFSLLNIKEEKYGLAGKINALAQGIEKTSGEIIMITDADCEVPVDWIEEYVNYFENAVGMVGGLTVLSKKEVKEKIFFKLQALDWIFLQAVASGSCQNGLPISILGNNFAFRREAYEQVGGFKNSGFSITEDMLLLQTIHQTGNWKIVYPLNNLISIYSKPVNNLSEFFQQRKRWVLGGRNTHWWGYFISIIALTTHLFMVGLALFGIWDLVFIIFLLTFLADLSLYGRILKRINRLDLFKMFLPFKLYYIFYTIIFSLVLLISRKVQWKDTSYNV